MADLLVHLEIPIPTEPLVGAPALTFAHWLPIGDSQAINIERDSIALKLWFDITTTWWASQPKEADLPHMVNVLAHRVFADAVVCDVPDDLLQYMAQRDFTRAPAPEEQPLEQGYDEVAERLLVLVLQTLNRLLSYVRSRKDQYWLSEYPIDSGRMSSYYAHFKAQARSGNGPWFRFGPSNILSKTLELVEEERYIRCDEWDEIRTFVRGGRGRLSRGRYLPGQRLWLPVGTPEVHSPKPSLRSKLPCMLSPGTRTRNAPLGRSWPSG